GGGFGSLPGGRVSARRPASGARQLVLLLGLLAAGHALLALPVGIAGLIPLLVVHGAAIAPSFALAYSMVDGVALRGTVTEAFTWLATGIAGGLAIGSGLGGVV